MSDIKIRSRPEPSNADVPPRPGEEVPRTVKGNFPGPPPPRQNPGTAGPQPRTDYSCILLMLIILGCMATLILMSLA